MEKKEIHAAVTIVFASMLTVFAMTGGNTQRGEMRQIQDSIRNLRRVDNLRFSYSYAVSDKNEKITNRTEVWSDQLTGSWAAEYYTTDADGTRLYLRRFCDGKAVYTYIDWSGEWEKQGVGAELEVPCMEDITAIDYGDSDIVDVKSERENGIMKISYDLAPEYLTAMSEENLASIEAYYGNYHALGDDGEDDSMGLAVAQYRQMRIGDASVVYKIDENEILYSGTCFFEIIQPGIVTGEDGSRQLGEEQKIQNLLTFQIIGYDQDSILDKIEQWESEIE